MQAGISIPFVEANVDQMFVPPMPRTADKRLRGRQIVGIERCLEQTSVKP